MTNAIGAKEPQGKHCLKNIFVSLAEILKT